MNDAITIDRLTKHYGPRRVVNNVSLNIPAGCVYGLLGRNGAGKSTLIKMLLGMVHQDSGTATLLGEDSRSLTPATRARSGLPGRRPPALSLDERRRGDPLHAIVLSAMERPLSE